MTEIDVQVRQCMEQNAGATGVEDILAEEFQERLERLLDYAETLEDRTIANQIWRLGVGLDSVENGHVVPRTRRNPVLFEDERQQHLVDNPEAMR